MRKQNQKDIQYKTKKQKPELQPFEANSPANNKIINGVRAFKNIRQVSDVEKQNMQIQQENFGKKFDELRNLTKQKDDLIEQLTLLKQGALHALIEKEQIIDRLKNQWDMQLSYEDQRSQMQKEMNKTLRKVKDLEQQRKQLMEKLEAQKNMYFEELYSRQTLIDTLDNKLRELQEMNDHLGEQNKDLMSKNYVLEQQKVRFQKKFKNLEQKLYQKDESVEAMCKCLENAENQEQLIEYLYTENSRDEENQVEQVYQKKIEQIIEYYENQVKDLMYELQIKNKSLEDRELRRTLESQGFDHSSLGSTKMKKFMNLKCDVKDIDNITNYNNKRHEQQNESQFTSKYFKYNVDPPKEMIKSVYQFEEINIQEEYEIEDEESVKNVEWYRKKEYLFGLAGTLIGASLTSLIFKMMKK